MMSLVGLLVLLGSCWALSQSRKDIKWRTILVGVVSQILLGLFILKTDIGVAIFATAKNAVNAFLSYSNEGAAFLFGPLVDTKKFGYVFAFLVLPTIIFTSSVMSVLYHMGIMQKIVKGFAWVMFRTMKISGAESLSAAANIFMGQTEAPLVVRPYVNAMTKSEIFTLMTGGLATVAGGVLAAFVGMGIDAAHLLAASVMSAPAAIVCAKLIVPETERSKTAGSLQMVDPQKTVNFIDAASKGAGEGLWLALNVGGMLLAFVALIALFNGILSAVGGWFSYPELSLELILGHLFMPVAFLLGVPWSETFEVGTLLGKKLVLNEFVAYIDLKNSMDSMSDRAVAISTYALCGFANFSSIAIQIGGIGTLAPSRKQDLARFGLLSLFAGTVACLMTACVAGLFL